MIQQRGETAKHGRTIVPGQSTSLAKNSQEAQAWLFVGWDLWK